VLIWSALIMFCLAGIGDCLQGEGDAVESCFRGELDYF